MEFENDTFLKFKQQMFCYLMLLISIHSASSMRNETSFIMEGNYSSQRCSLWQYYAPSTKSCQCLSFHKALLCDGMKAYIHVSDMLTVTVKLNESLVSISHSKSYNTYHGINGTKLEYRLLPENMSELNNFMCGPLNRKGYLCQHCIDGYGPSVSLIEHPNDCFRCTNNWRGLVLILVIALVPITVFYLVILIFQIRMTSAPMPCFIMYSQLIVIACTDTWGRSFNIAAIVFSKAGDIRLVSKIIFVLYGIFNLDFISHAMPPFSVTTYMTLYHRAILGYITAFYPMLLILMTWICIELHNRNFRVIVYLWRPFHRCFVRLRRGWDAKNDLIDVFANFYLLSFAKALYQTKLMTFTTVISTYSLSGEYLNIRYVSDVDNSIMITSSNYIIGCVFAVLIFIIFNVVPLLLLVLYPFGRFRKILTKLRLDGVSLMIFMERFHCCYRDGLDGRRDMRYFSGFYFFIFMPLFIIPAILYYFGLDLWFTRELCF